MRILYPVKISLKNKGNRDGQNKTIPGDIMYSFVTIVSNTVLCI